MQFLSMIRINENSGKRPDQQLMDDMGKLMDEMTKAGIMLDTAGLYPTSQGVRVKLSHGKISQTDGPFTETKEVIGGYWFIVAASLEEAAEIASHNPCLAFGLTLEIGQLEPERAHATDITNETPAEWRRR